MQCIPPLDPQASNTHHNYLSSLTGILKHAAYNVPNSKNVTKGKKLVFLANTAVQPFDCVSLRSTKTLPCIVVYCQLAPTCP